MGFGVEETGFFQGPCPAPDGGAVNSQEGGHQVQGEVEGHLSGLSGGLGACGFLEVAAAEDGEEEEETEGSCLEAPFLGQGQEVLEGLVLGVLLAGFGQGFLEEAPDPGQGAVLAVVDGDFWGWGCFATFRIQRAV
jgi:hypothetical protein